MEEPPKVESIVFSTPIGLSEASFRLSTFLQEDQKVSSIIDDDDKFVSNSEEMNARLNGVLASLNATTSTQPNHNKNKSHIQTIQRKDIDQSVDETSAVDKLESSTPSAKNSEEKELQSLGTTSPTSPFVKVKEENKSISREEKRAAKRKRREDKRVAKSARKEARALIRKSREIKKEDPHESDTKRARIKSTE
eukprot:CAMPEP_0184857072 /NCGR_PEP_ID=MMETSP0580-20130426/2243_1 /TAXON_ID=1118495 /ORGANISM="Dactyliosolen fragilissimus" /LENGTH=193 /DNA_ID=CAMNT_0027352457 /DNA_START=238 /DNA_END=819 /DNA_ORIENTATION=+